MARLIRQDLLFIHSAKTGGTFLRETINRFGIPNYEVGAKHCNLEEAVQLCKPTSSIGFIRNPISWYRSRWAYARMTYFAEKLKYMPEAQNHWMANVWSNNLNDFVSNIIETYPDGVAYTYFNDMLKFDSPIQILRYENLLWETEKIIEYCGYKNFYLPPTKVLSSEKILGTISPVLIKEIEKAEVKLLNKFYSHGQV